VCSSDLQDTNGDRLFTERPSFAPSTTNCSSPPANIVCTPYGNFNLRPAPGEALIPRNLGEGPSFLSVNMRISKTWSFGTIHSASAANKQEGQQRGAQARGGGGGGRGGAGVPQIPGGGGGGRGGGGGGGRGGGGGGLAAIGGPAGGGGAAEAKRYTMQFSLNFQNILNTVNLSPPVGNLSSPFFGQSLSLNGGFGGFGPGGGGGGGGGGGAGNRRVTAQIRFNF